jgi:hypothetical protein
MAFASNSPDLRESFGRGWAMPFHSRACLYALLCFWGCMPGLQLHAQPVSREYDLKAVLLFNLAQFVEWPSNAFTSKDQPVVIGILGRDPFREVLDDVVRGEIVQGRKLTVKRYSSARAAQEANILFIAQSEEVRIPRILAELKDKPILTVSDIENFARRGGMVRFFINAEAKIKLRVNIDVVKQHGLGISSKLLRVSEVEHLQP